MSDAPVFVDDSGRRRVLTRRAGRVVLAGFAGYLGLVVLGFTREPAVGPIHLPTFGLPSLALSAPPAPSSVLGEQADRAAASAGTPVGEPSGRTGEEPANPSEPAVTVAGQPGVGSGALVPATAPAGARTTKPAPSSSTTTTAPVRSGGPSGTSTSTTVPTTSSTAPTTTSTRPGQGQSQGQGTAVEPAKGPGGDGAPGQIRRSTTTTTAAP